MSIWNGFDEADVEIHGDELDAEQRAYEADMQAELDAARNVGFTTCADCCEKLAQGDAVTEDCGACDEVRYGFVR